MKTNFYQFSVWESKYDVMKIYGDFGIWGKPVEIYDEFGAKETSESSEHIAEAKQIV